MRDRAILLAVIGIAGAVACSSAPPAAPAPAVATSPVCDSLALVAATAQPEWFTKVPEPTHMVMPPQGKPSDYKTAPVVITFFVDRSGYAPPDSIRITGTADSSYIKRIRPSLTGYKFRPATRGECAVPGHHVQRITY